MIDWHEPGPQGFVVGRVWRPAVPSRGSIGGPTPVAVRDTGVYDLSAIAPTVSELLDRPDLLRVVSDPGLPKIADLEEVRAGSDPSRRDPDRCAWLSPIDLQVIKACGVTFAVSAIERVIEERAGGRADMAAEVRDRLTALIGTDLSDVRPGSERADRLKQELVASGLWSAYLEVALGPDAEVFTKAPVLSSVGHRQRVGVRRASAWNNSEPEAVLVIDSRHDVVGATLGNDMNLRDFEGRSALLLGEAKDANASCAIGPWIRLFDGPGGFTMETLLASSVELDIRGLDGFEEHGRNRLAEISRHPDALVRQVTGSSHQYPDGLVLFLGTMFVPRTDRDRPGAGFTHHPGDVVAISEPNIGTLLNEVGVSEELEPWDFGIRALWQNLAARDLLGRADPAAASTAGVGR
jgi:fumarylacetoacetate (FAA) hydrolase family protein